MTETSTHGSALPVMALTREQIAARLRQYRESLGFTQTAVALDTGVFMQLPQDQLLVGARRAES